MKSTKQKGPTKTELARKAKELEAQLAFSYHAASTTLHKARDLMASGVMVELTALGCRQLIVPVVIRDGLSQDTIEALQRDIARSFGIATAQKPKGFV